MARFRTTPSGSQEDLFAAVAGAETSPREARGRTSRRQACQTRHHGAGAYACAAAAYAAAAGTGVVGRDRLARRDVRHHTLGEGLVVHLGEGGDGEVSVRELGSGGVPSSSLRDRARGRGARPRGGTRAGLPATSDGAHLVDVLEHLDHLLHARGARLLGGLVLVLPPVRVGRRLGRLLLGLSRAGHRHVAHGHVGGRVSSRPREGKSGLRARVGGGLRSAGAGGRMGSSAQRSQGEKENWRNRDGRWAKSDD